MNPLFKALTGGIWQAPAQMAGMTGMTGMTGMMGGAMNGPMGMAGWLMGRVQQLAGMLRNPQQMVAMCFPDAPAEVAGDPDSLLQWMQQTGKVNPQMVQAARQMMGR